MGGACPGAEGWPQIPGCVCAPPSRVSASGGAARDPKLHCFPVLPIVPTPIPGRFDFISAPLSGSRRVWPHLGRGSLLSHDRGWDGFPFCSSPSWSSALSTEDNWLCCPLQVNSVNCNTSWKINLFMQFRDHLEEVLKGVSLEPLPAGPFLFLGNDCLGPVPLHLSPRKSPCVPANSSALGSPYFPAKDLWRPPHPVLYLRVARSLEHPFLSLVFIL